MALTTVAISTAGLGLATAVTPVAVALVSGQPYLTDATHDIQRVISTATAADGTLSLALVPNASLSDTTSTYTFTIGANVLAPWVTNLHPASAAVSFSMAIS